MNVLSHVLTQKPVADLVARLFSAAVRPAAKPGVSFLEIEGHASTISIPTRLGPVDATVYRPGSVADPTLPVYVNIHGGGFTVGNRHQDDPWCRYLSARAGVVVVNSDYVLTPGHRFPAPVEQLYDVTRWVSAAPDWDGTRLCIGGQSAGGSLAAAVSRLALEIGEPRISLQMLHYPPLDLVTSCWDKASPIGKAAVLKPWMSDVFDTAYIPDREDRRDRLASPAWGANADDLAGIAPAVIVTAEYDRLRAEAERFAEKLHAVGALVAYREVTGLDHGYNIMSDTPQAVVATRETYDLVSEYVQRATA
ncbi:alpha/beta hydrolase [Mycobacterium sp. 236(2023)]|uniref:alpha/beta hydrolase n=1 Tax=Mycobacterium sp. 236(2023) TaxID=3038163 RepID=UPI0024156647|nr:alpha/beta hydrolase [Mycobacterium sp. 236(2023)]MDG4665598.1 alpha/beta hydrolase [Mycobacterium sp. 236(2023)]